MTFQVLLKLFLMIFIKVKFTLEQTMKSQSGVEVYPYSFFNFGSRWGGWSTPHPCRFNPGKDPVPIE
jgi:hypothetical protein